MTYPSDPYHPYGQQPPPPAAWQPPPPYAPPQQFPARAVSRQKLNPFETFFHLCATVCTGGLWGFVWWARVRSRKTVTRFR